MLDTDSIPYHEDSRILFDAIWDLPYACWLDSGGQHYDDGRYDILTACPTDRYVTQGKCTAIYRCNVASGQSQLVRQSEEDPFSLVESAVNRLACQDTRFPFIGGAIGYLGYDLGRQLIDFPDITESRCRLPDMQMGIYHWAIVQDHRQQQSFLVSLPSCDSSVLTTIKRRLQAAIDNSVTTSQYQKTAQPFTIGELCSNMTTESYGAVFRKIENYINAGDCYQINLAQCFYAAYQGDPYWAYQKLRQQMASPFSAYLSMGDQHLLCCSPERFVKINDHKAITQPIKGTISRHNDAVIDDQLAEELQHSEKNRAENLMIVDLLRNDLGKTCIPGSIQVDKLFALRSFPNVHHLVSTISGEIDPNYSAVDALKACFPGGSITGAPKKRAMEIIEELEPFKRSAYCGSVSYISANGCLDSNIIIRSVICDGQQLFCWSGGGIVADSDVEDEYQEGLLKVQRILDILRCSSSEPLAKCSSSSD